MGYRYENAQAKSSKRIIYETNSYDLKKMAVGNVIRI